MSARVYIGLGSNLGDKSSNLRNAISSIEERCGDVIAVSKFFSSEPWGYDSDQDYINAVLELRSELPVIELLAKLKEIEAEMGRVQQIKGVYEDRVIDLDIVDYDGLHIDTQEIEIPHPRMHLRDFVLEPLNELNSEWLHPVLNRSITGLLLDLKNQAV